jgi:hypothetical protein
LKKCAWLTTLGLAMIAAAGFKAQDVKPIVNPPMRNQSLDVHEDSATASLVGQFRTSVSSWLWLRADLYLHNGVEMRPISEQERKRGVTVQRARDDGHEAIHEGDVITTVPPKERDFRGIFGDVERQVASYKDMHEHSHNDPQVAMPLYRLMTWLDPQFVQGWTMGGMILARDRSEAGTQRSIAFLKEGWKANPSSVDIPSQIGYTIATREKKLVTASRYLERARKLGVARFKELGENEREGLRTAYRFLALCYRDMGETAKQKAVIIEGIKVFPDDPLLPRLAKEVP